MKIRCDSLDALFSEFIRKRSNGFCERCGKYYGWERLQCCHFHGRSKRSVRFDEANACALCFGDHQYFHSRPLEFVEWFKQRLGEQGFDLLNSRARTPARYLDKAAITLYLKEEIKKLELER